MHPVDLPTVVFLLLVPSLSWSFMLNFAPPRGSLGQAPSNSFSIRPSPRLHSAASDPYGEAGGGAFSDTGSWKLTNDFYTFLNQVTIQSLVFLIHSLKDRHTAIWLEDFTQPVIRSRSKDKPSDQVLSNMATALNDALRETQMERPVRLLTYHGIGAINTTIFPTWDSYFEQLLQDAGVTYFIESTRPRVPSYELEINPASLCSRLISVREQIAREFVKDLDVIADISGAMMQRYLDSSGAAGGMEKPNLLFLESSVHSDYLPSPLRKGNFDLLMTLATQEAIHRVLNDASSSSQQSDKSSILFLRNFYVNRIHTHFTGSNRYGRAEDFLEELLKSSPSAMQQLQGGEDCDFWVDPLRVADLVLKHREQVAEEWLEMALDVPQSHTAIKRMQFNRLMGREIDERIESGFE
jgi:hypothetical protein